MSKYHVIREGPGEILPPRQLNIAAVRRDATQAAAFLPVQRRHRRPRQGGVPQAAELAPGQLRQHTDGHGTVRVDIAAEAAGDVYAVQRRRVHVPLPEQHLDPSTLGAELGRLYKANLLNQVWAKLFSAEMVKSGQIRFPDYRWGEDRLFIFDCLERAGSVAVLPECKYSYIMHPGQSLISSYYDKKFEVCLAADTRAQQLCRRFGAEDDEDFRYMFAKSVFSCLTTLFSPGCRLNRNEKRGVIRGIITNEQLRERSRKPFGGAAVKLLSAVMRSGSVTLNYAVFRFVAWAGQAAPRVFTKLKHRK